MNKNILIVGGGVIGLSAALGLSLAGHTVSVFDSRSLKPNLIYGDDMRVYAINDASKKLFERLGCWEAIVNQRVSPYQKMHVWDAGSEGELHFDCLQFAKPQLGFIIEEQAIKNALLSKLINHPLVTLIENTELLEMDEKANQIVLHTKERLHKGDLLIGADGANSWVKKKARFETKETPYGHHALVAKLKTEKSHDKTAWQIFTPTGPLAFLPLSDPNHSSIVYSSHESHIKHLMGLEEGAFCADIQKAFESKLGKVMETSKRVTFPLVERHTQQYVKPKIALMGDALHTIHPLAGLGVNLGLKDVSAFLDCASDNKDTFPAFSVLRRYERSRKGHNALVIEAMRAIKSTFSFTGFPAMLRGVGMNFISDHFIIKKIIAEHAFM
jgi:2-octaprenylphenol hydroxylase